MPVVSNVRSQIESILAPIDPIGSEVRKLKQRTMLLEKKREISSKEYKELSSSHLRIVELESQRKEHMQFETMLDPSIGKLLKLSKAFDKITAEYDAGKLDPSLYKRSLERLLDRLRPVQEKPVQITASMVPDGSFMGLCVNALEQACGAVFLIMIILPALYSCSLH